MISEFLEHYFTVQDNSNYHGEDESGALQRTNFPIIIENAKCNYQEVSKQDAELKYNIKVAAKLIVLYHREQITFDETIRVLINTNPFRKVSKLEHDTMVCEYKGHRKPVLNRDTRLDCFELYLEHNKRWRI